MERARRLGLLRLKHFGIDYCDPDKIPEGFVFKKVDLNHQPIPFDDDQFDLVVASHVIEHLGKPLEFFAECARVCKPGGLMYFEAPSERSLLLPGMPFEHDKFFSTSFFDDPTHASRPWTPQSFYRLAKYYSCEPLRVGYRTSWKYRLLFPVICLYALATRSGKWLEACCWYAIGWASFMVVRKPSEQHGKPAFRYYIPTTDRASL
jgi:SAM-dependent methyltransferase